VSQNGILLARNFLKNVFYFVIFNLFYCFLFCGLIGFFSLLVPQTQKEMYTVQGGGE
jgi:hypothetical protein